MADSYFKVEAGDKFIVDHGGAAAAANAGLYVAGTKVVGAQGASVADASDATDVILRVNDLIDRLEAHGLIASNA